jgi:hypothetical protein
MAKSDDGLSFTKAEAGALKLIVADWLGEELVVPPFEPKIEAVLKKLDLAMPKSERAASITQDLISERAATRPQAPSAKARVSESERPKKKKSR